MRILSAILFVIITSYAHGQTNYNEWVLASVEGMPRAGGYELTSKPVKKLRDAFTWSESTTDLDLRTSVAVPSYCTTATYIVFFEVLQRYFREQNYSMTLPVLERLKPNLERDGLRIWGRWNSNGPGTAKFFHDTGLGVNFDDPSLARPGDFLKIFWNGEVGKNERGHTVIFLGYDRGHVRFWGSSKGTNGYGVMTVGPASYKKLLFSRLTAPENAESIGQIPEDDTFLASMLTRVSSWAEVKRVSGF